MHAPLAEKMQLTIMTIICECWRDCGFLKSPFHRRIYNNILQKLLVCVSDVPGVEMNKTQTKSVKEGESLTLDPGVMKNSNDLMMWYFNDTFIAKINGDPSRICTDDQCEDADVRFRDRLRLDHQTGSLTITNTRTTDSGVYHLKIITNSSSIRRRHIISIVSQNRFSVSITGEYNSVHKFIFP